MKHNNPDHELYIPLELTERQLHGKIKKILEPDFVCLTKKPLGYCYVSAHWQNIYTQKVVNVFSGDLRDIPYHGLGLTIRTAQHEKDYRGGANRSTSLETLKEDAFALTQGEQEYSMPLKKCVGFDM